MLSVCIISSTPKNTDLPCIPDKTLSHSWVPVLGLENTPLEFLWFGQKFNPAMWKPVILPLPAVSGSWHNLYLVPLCESVDASVVCGGQGQPHVLFLRTPSTLYFEIGVSDFCLKCTSLTRLASKCLCLPVLSYSSIAEINRHNQGMLYQKGSIWLAILEW